MKVLIEDKIYEMIGGVFHDGHGPYDRMGLPWNSCGFADFHFSMKGYLPDRGSRRRPANSAKITVLNLGYKAENEVLKTALWLALHRTIDPCPALPCESCPGFYTEGSETEEEACTRGKVHHYMERAHNEK